MSEMITKCPQCEATFRVTDAQLQMAKGKVRCGSCLHVFKADDHWLNAPAAAPAPPVTPATDKPTSGKFVFDQSAIDESTAEKVLTKPSIPAINTQGEMKAVPSAPPPAPEPSGESLDFDDDGLRISDDDEEVRFDDGNDAQFSDTQESDIASDDDDYSDIFLNLDDLQDDEFNTTEFEEIEDESLEAGGSDESWAKELLDDLEDDSEQRAEQEKELLSGEAEMEEVFADDGYVKKREGARDAFVSDQSMEVDARRDLGLDKPAPRGALLAKIEPAPVEMDWRPSGKSWLGALLWSAMSLLMVAVFALQYGWLQFESLAREKQYRPVYAAACQVFGCSLPDLFNPSAIRSSNLVVRSHPKMENVLIVDTILQNMASYSQPFPDLELYFNTLDNFPVASRRFTAREYLAGELAGKKMMPSAKSIHISLQIVDPGDEAVNYRLEISTEKPADS